MFDRPRQLLPPVVEDGLGDLENRVVVFRGDLGEAEKMRHGAPLSGCLQPTKLPANMQINFSRRGFLPCRTCPTNLQTIIYTGLMKMQSESARNPVDNFGDKWRLVGLQ
jgi:hypothetical protein